VQFPTSKAFICCLLAAASPALLHGQSAPDRRFLDSILTAAQGAAAESAVPLLSRCDGRDANVVRICQATIAVYHAPLAGKREEVFAAEDVAIHAVFERDRWPYAWLVLGLVRLQLAHDKVLPHEGPAMTAGTSNELGAANALIQALELDPTLRVAAEALAGAPEPREGRDAMAPQVAMLRRVMALLSPSGSARAALIERDAGSVDSAIAVQRRALAAGNIDSGVVLLSLARDLYRTNHPAEGRKALLLGSAVTSEAARRAYRAELSWVASPAELAQWDSLAPRARPAWLAGFWSSRDVAEGRPDGARLIEHYHRLEYAMAHFRISAPGTDRSQVLSFLHSNEYLPEEQALDFAARHGNICPETARFAADAKRLGADAPERYFLPPQDLLDDRGAVWIRHGPPAKSRQSNGAEAAEIWRYERPEGPLVLQFRAAAFRGTNGVSVLVPSLLTVAPGVRNQICALETSICSRLGVSGPLQPGDTILVPPPLIQSSGDDATCRMCPPRIDPMTHRVIRNPATANGVRAIVKANERCQDPIARILEREMNAEGTLLGTQAIIRARDRGREEIDIATTTDTYHRDFTKTIHPATQVVGLDRAAGGAPRLVVAYAIPADDIGYDKPDVAGLGVSYPVRVQVMAANIRTGERIDVDSLTHFSAEAPLNHGQSITGLLEVPLPAGTYSVGIVATQADGRGATVATRNVSVPGALGRLSVSNIVLGREKSPVQWNSGTRIVTLNPLGTYPKGGAADVYFQLSGMSVGASYQMRFEFFRVDDEPRHAPRLSISFLQPVTQDRIEVARSLGLKNLDAGRYQVKLTVTGDGAQATTTSWLTIEK
jgi:GWxTD domain-containing protein